MCELAVVAFEKATGNVIDELERTDYFTDTTDKNILKAYEYGIVSGYPDGSFQPNKTLTRQEFFKIIQNFCEAAAYTSTRSKEFKRLCGLRLHRFLGARGSAAVRLQRLCRRHEDRLFLLPPPHRGRKPSGSKVMFSALIKTCGSGIMSTSRLQALTSTHLKLTLL